MTDVGFFAQPGDDAAKNGLTVWMPPAVYIPQRQPERGGSQEICRISPASVDGCKAIMAEINTAQGPSLVDGCELPADVPAAVKDMLPYFEAKARLRRRWNSCRRSRDPPLNRSPSRSGPASAQPAEAAALYDEDVRKQAKQLGHTQLVRWPASRQADLALQRARSPRRSKEVTMAEAQPPLTQIALSARGFSCRPPPIYGVLFARPDSDVLSGTASRAGTCRRAEFIGLENFRQFFSEPFLVQGPRSTR